MFDRLDTDPADAVGGGGPDETWVDRECPFDDDEDAPPLPEDVEFVEPSAGEWLESACAMRPGAGLLDALGEVVLSDVSADEAVTMLQEMQRVAARRSPRMPIRIGRRVRSSCARSRWPGLRSRLR